MGCGCAERRAKMKAWIVKQHKARVAKRLEKKRLEEEARKQKENNNETK